MAQPGFQPANERLQIGVRPDGQALAVAGDGLGDASLLLQGLRLIAQFLGTRLARLLLRPAFLQLCDKGLQFRVRPQNETLFVTSDSLRNPSLLLLGLRLVTQLLRLRLAGLLVSQPLLQLADKGLQFRIGPDAQALLIAGNGLRNAPLLLQGLRLVAKLLRLSLAILLLGLRPFQTGDVRLKPLVPLDVQARGIVLYRLSQVALILRHFPTPPQLVGLCHLLAVIGDLPSKVLCRVIPMLPFVQHALQYRNGRTHVLVLLELGR